MTTICPTGVETEFALGAGRSASDPGLADFLRPEDLAFQISTVLAQPRRLRTGVWTLWSMAEGS